MTPAVVFENVSKKFWRGERHDSLRDLLPSMARKWLRPQPADALLDQEFWALRNVSFEVSAGEALGIIGSNGAGKSTTLKLLTKILRPTIGRCQVTGRVGALIEIAAGFHGDLTGRENVYLQGAIMGMRRAEISRRFDEIVEFAGAGPFIDTPVKRYSSGMNARLGFSIAAHLEPDVLIIDEVLSVGDLAFQQKCFDRMMDFRRQGIAIVLVSHNLQAIGTLCERAVYLAGGVRAAGATAEVIDAYVRASQKMDRPAAGSRIELLDVSFLQNGQSVGPYTSVTSQAAVSVRITARTVAQCGEDVTVGFTIHRSTDQLLVYEGHVPGRELMRSAALNEPFVLTLTFRANVLRGHYYLSLNVLNNPTQELLMPDCQIGTLTVRESRSSRGIAEIEMAAAFSTGGRLRDLQVGEDANMESLSGGVY